MKKKLVGILIVMLFIITAVSPVTNAFIISTTIKKEKTPKATDDRPEIVVQLPDVHIYYPKSHIQWGTVVFEDPGAIVDVNLSEIEGEEINLGIDQKVICHVARGRILPACVWWSTNLNLPEWSEGVSTIFDIHSSQNWEWIIWHRWALIYKVEDEDYSMLVATTGIPALFKGFALAYFFIIMMFLPEKIYAPNPFEERFGETAEYILHVHT